MNSLRSLQLALALVISGATQPAVAQIPISAGQPIMFGRGTDTIRGGFRGQCVQQTPVQEVTDGASSGGTVTDFRAELIDSTQHLSRSLGLEVTAGYRWGFGSVNASFQYATSSDFNSHDVFVLVRTTITNSTRALTQPAFTPEAAALYAQDSAAFERACGDEFITTITSGGELIAMLRIETSSRSDREAIRGSLQGSYLGFSAAAQLETQLASLSRSHRITMRVLRAGGGGTIPPADPVALLTYARETFPQLVTSMSIPRQFATSSYETIPMPGELRDRVVRLSMLRLAERLDTAIQGRNDTLYTQRHHDICENAADPSIDEKLAEYDEFLDAITEHALDCANNPTRACPRFARAVPRPVACAEQAPVPEPRALTLGPFSMSGIIRADLPSMHACRIVRGRGFWTEGRHRGPHISCNEYPRPEIRGSVFASDFDSEYNDNGGDCEYEVVCCASPFVPDRDLSVCRRP